jgi:predicted Fe-Mo cluster-binding NifX family protein
MKLLIAIDENRGENSKLSEHFGHCPYFAIYDTDSKRLVIVKNELEHANPNLSPVDQIMKFKPDVVFTLGIG